MSALPDDAGEGRRPCVCFYGDDFTGAADNLAQYHREGLRALMFLDTPTPQLLARHAGALDVVGVAGVSRSLPPDRMDAEVRPSLEAFRRLEPHVVQYKICSTFDSAPDMGSFGRVIELARGVFGNGPIPVVAGCPDFGRYTVFGQHFAQFMGAVHRLDRHPTMSSHPSTPMHEADLRRHLAQQTSLPTALLDIVAMKAGEEAFRGALRRTLQEEPAAIVFDVLDNLDLDRAAAATWDLAAGGRSVFTLSAKGLASGLARHLARRGLGGRSVVTNAALQPVDRLLVLSGSCSPQTAAQIERARAAGWSIVTLDVPALLEPPRAAATLARTVAAVQEALARAPGCVVATALGPEDPAVAAVRDALRRLGLAAERLAPAIGAAFGALLTSVGERVELPRVVLAGGDTSSHTMRTVDAYGLAIHSSSFAIHSHVCRLLSDNPKVAGTQVLLKGGQGGSEDLFLRVRSAEGWN